MPDHPWFMGVGAVPWLRGIDQVRAFPFVPVHKVIGTGKGVKCLRPVKGPEIKHNIYFPDFSDLGVTGNPASIINQRFKAIPGPVCHIPGNSHGDALVSVFRFGIIIHDEWISQDFLWIMDNILL